MLTIEIVFRGEEWTDLTAKIKDHTAAGVQSSLIIDPYERTLFIAGKDGLLRQVGPSLKVDITLPAGTLHIDADQLFQQLD